MAAGAGSRGATGLGHLQLTPVAPLCRRGSAPCPQLCLALATLQVLSSGKGTAGNVAQEEEGKDTKSLVLLWP